MKIEISSEVIAKIERIIELYDNYKASTHLIDRALKSIGKNQIEIAAIHINYNPEEDRLIHFVKNLKQQEKDLLKAILEFGKDFDAPNREDFKFYIEKCHLRGDYEIHDMIAKPLSKHLKNGLMKLDLILRTN